MFLKFICFFYIITPWKPMRGGDPNEMAIAVVFACVANAFLVTSGMYFFDIPKELLGIPTNADFWPLFKVFGVGVGIWTLVGYLLSHAYAEQIKEKEDRKNREGFSEVWDEMMDDIRNK